MILPFNPNRAVDNLDLVHVRRDLDTVTVDFEEVWIDLARLETPYGAISCRHDVTSGHVTRLPCERLSARAA
jgi:hypothetical protein